MPRLTRALFLLLLMTFAAETAWIMTPRQFLAETRPPIDLQNLLPHHFETWREVSASQHQIVNPQQAELLDTIYSQTLSRTYVNVSGQYVMISLAYGKDQRAYMAVHYPEACYPAQGFQVSSISTWKVKLPNEEIAIRRLSTSLGGGRPEAVSYWTTIGDYRSLGGLRKRLTELKYGLKGQIPDGLLFRISSIGVDQNKEFEIQERFITALLLTSEPSIKRGLIGTFEE